MATAPQFTEKRTGETITLTWDFVSLLGSAETISTQVVTATVFQGTDASPSSIISGSATASGTKVSQAITAGTDGVTYTLQCRITTSASQTLDGIALLKVSDTVKKP